VIDVAPKKKKAKTATKPEKAKKSPAKKSKKAVKRSAVKKAKAAVKMVPAKKAEAALDDPEGSDLRGAEATAAARTRDVM
jgi:hypothetical protein